jgi:ferredoxin
MDYSRCVTCFNCIETCNRNALKFAPVGQKTKSCRTLDCYNYQKGNQTVDDSKRRFLSATLITGIAAGKLLAQESAGKLLPKKTSNERHPCTSGSIEFRTFAGQMHIVSSLYQQCPSHVLKPAFSNMDYRV